MLGGRAFALLCRRPIRPLPYLTHSLTLTLFTLNCLSSCAYFATPHLSRLALPNPLFTHIMYIRSTHTHTHTHTCTHTHTHIHAHARAHEDRRAWLHAWLGIALVALPVHHPCCAARAWCFAKPKHKKACLLGTCSVPRYLGRHLVQLCAVIPYNPTTHSPPGPRLSGIAGHGPPEAASRRSRKAGRSVLRTCTAVPPYGPGCTMAKKEK